MRFSHAFLLGALLALTACGGSSTSRPTYSGKEQSTAGVPGFSPDGKRKLHPTVKLGQSYTVSGKTYVPTHQPDYDETGLASWYGPGFHGGKTANGEKFSTHDMTAAHTTLPLPSIVKVTYLKTGRSAIVRVNDRGPFAHNRIIDLSRAAAEEIGMLRDGVGKVRVQYMPAESERFAELLSQGREPGSINLASEVIGRSASTTQYANVEPADDSVEVVDTLAAGSPAPSSVWDRVNPIASAHAENTPQMPVPSTPANSPVRQVQGYQPVVNLPAPTAQAGLPPASLPAANAAAYSPNVVVQPPIVVAPAAVPPAQPELAPVAPAPPGVPVENIRAPVGAYVQLGAFSVESNAINLQSRFNDLANTHIAARRVGDATLYRVRMGPFVTDVAALEMLARARAMGVADAKLVVEH